MTEIYVLTRFEIARYGENVRVRL